MVEVSRKLAKKILGFLAWRVGCRAWKISVNKVKREGQAGEVFEYELVFLSCSELPWETDERVVRWFLGEKLPRRVGFTRESEAESVGPEKFVEALLEAQERKGGVHVGEGSLECKEPVLRQKRRPDEGEIFFGECWLFKEGETLEEILVELDLQGK